MKAEISRHPDWPRPRARLALDLNFTTSRRQPPSLERLAKHYLDQLGATHDRGEGGHLYRDDEQVQLLHVSAHHGWDVDGPRYRPRIWVTARTAAEATADLYEAAKLPDEDIHEQTNDVDWDTLREQLRDAERIAQSTHPELRGAAPLMRFMVLQGAQEALLRSSDRWLGWAVGDAAPNLLTGTQARQAMGTSALESQLRELEQDRRAMARETLLGAGPHSIRLPSLPASPGEGASFRDGIRDAIRGYVSRSTVLFPLLVPTRLSVVVVQPEQARDLDNILLDLLPVVDEIMRPPQEPWLLDAAGALDEVREDDPIATCKRRGLRRLRSVIEHGVWSAQVLELKRAHDDPPEGRLAMMLGHGENMESLWAEALSRLDEWDERSHNDW